LQLTEKQSLAITFIRAMSIVLIVITHFFQANESYWAWWLNVGVQVFLFMSGFLFGGKHINNISFWYQKRFKKILIPYYIYIIIVLPIYFLLIGEVSITKTLGYALNLQGITGTLNGLGHLWFLTVIMLCYFITPGLQILNISRKENKELKYYLLLAVLCLGIQTLSFFLPFSSDPWIIGPGIITYILGYYTSKRYEGRIPNKIFLLLLLGTLMIVPLNLFTFLPGLTIIFTISHILIGSLIFVGLYKLISEKNVLLKENFQVIRQLDKYSFEIYITHLIYIIGPFALIKLTTFSVVNVLLILLLILISSYTLKKIQTIFDTLLTKNTLNRKTGLSKS